jgi:hypothetical protein
MHFRKATKSEKAFNHFKSKCSLSAREDEDAEHADEQVLDIRIIVHNDRDDAYPGKECSGLSYDVTSIQEQLS